MRETREALPKIVPAEEWSKVREQLLVKEKDLTRQLDALAAERRRLPMVRIEKNYTFDGPLGQVSLLVDGGSVKLPYAPISPDATYQSTTNNESQAITYQGLTGLPAFADVGELAGGVWPRAKAARMSPGLGAAPALASCARA